MNSPPDSLSSASQSLRCKEGGQAKYNIQFSLFMKLKRGKTGQIEGRGWIHERIN